MFILLHHYKKTKINYFVARERMSTLTVIKRKARGLETTDNPE